MKMNNKRTKKSRHRGSHTHGRGAKKKARGSGHRGGVGKAGTGKRADHKKSSILNKFGNKYFGKDKVRRAATKIEEKVMNLQNLAENIESFVQKGIATLNKGVYEIDLKDHKIIGDANLNIKLRVNAKAASQGALEAIKQSGGEITITKGSSKVGLRLDKDEKEFDAEIGSGDEKVGLKIKGNKNKIEASVSEGTKKASITIEKEVSEDGEKTYSVKVGGSLKKKKDSGKEEKNSDDDKDEGNSGETTS